MIEEKNGRLSVRVGDFGNARLCTKEMISTVGTNLYMAPEIFRL